MGYELDRDDDGLTAREREVLAMLESGMLVSEIAKDLGLTRQRVHAVKRSLERKGVKWLPREAQ